MTARTIVGQLIGAVGTLLLTLALVTAWATPAFAQSGTTCTNGGGGYTTCVTAADGRTCTEATAGSQCDTPITCTCKASLGKGCVCG